MIFGVGTDILQIERVASLHRRFGRRFAERVLMPEELAGFSVTATPERFLAMRFAAKEAIVKAMGTGFVPGMWLRDAGVLPDPKGRPLVIWSARGRRLCDSLGIGAAHLSLSDEAGLVVAMVVLLQKA